MFPNVVFSQVRRDVSRQREKSVLEDRAVITTYYKSPVGTRYRLAFSRIFILFLQELFANLTQFWDIFA
jgi:hypothetical protein